MLQSVWEKGFNAVFVKTCSLATVNFFYKYKNFSKMNALLIQIEAQDRQIVIEIEFSQQLNLLSVQSEQGAETICQRDKILC